MMDTFIQIAERLKDQIDQLLPKSVSPGIIKHINDTIDSELTTEDTTRSIERCRLLECDFDGNWIKLKISKSTMEKGFHGGIVVADLSRVQ